MKLYKKIADLQQGFTLVELMVTMVIAFVITGAAYASYVVQQKNYTIQEQVAQMQQTARVGLEIMSSEMRMAGYDPTFCGEYGIVTANAGQFGFTTDLCNDGGVPGTCVVGGESITETYLFELYDSGNGVNDTLRRTPGGSAVAENIQHLEFLYTLKDGTQTLAPTALELDKIVTVEISILARSTEEDHKYKDSQTYTTGAGNILGPFPDNKYRRRMFITTLQLRNMGYRS